MSRLSNAIEEVKNGRVGAWIYNERGEIRTDVFVGDTVELMEDWLNHEVEFPNLTDEEISDIIEYNTYNWGANISNDIAFGFYNKEIMIAMVHISGDARCNYSELFALDFGSIESLADNMPYLSKDVDETHVASFSMFNEGMDVWNTELEDEIVCYEIELEDLLNEIADKESEE